MNLAATIWLNWLLMRIRTIKPEYWAHEMHATISESAGLLGAALLCYADDEGRFKVQFQGIQGQLFTYRKLTTPLEQAFQELVDIGYLRTYTAQIDGRPALVCQVVTFKEHQTINKPRPSRLPAPPRSDTGTLPDRFRSDTGTLPGEGRKEGKGRNEGEQPLHTPFQEPDWEEVLSFAVSRKISEKTARKFFLEQKKVRWMHRGSRVEDWQSGLESYAMGWAENEAKDAGKKTAAPDMAQLEAEAEAEPDLEKRRALRTKIKKLRGET